jgi:hypothetical protein
VNCDAKIRPFPSDTELTCIETVAGHDQHIGVAWDMAYPGSATEITWFEDDRRNFRGEYRPCPEQGCVLPGGHPRDHHVE